jgi:hypothetical protein
MPHALLRRAEQRGIKGRGSKRRLDPGEFSQVTRFGRLPAHAVRVQVDQPGQDVPALRVYALRGLWRMAHFLSRDNSLDLPVLNQDIAGDKLPTGEQHPPILDDQRVVLIV